MKPEFLNGTVVQWPEPTVVMSETVVKGDTVRHKSSEMFVETPILILQFEDPSNMNQLGSYTSNINAP
jgi:hypothetical protein